VLRVSTEEVRLLILTTWCQAGDGRFLWYRERLNIEVNTSTSWSAHPLRTQPGMPSGPGDFCGFTVYLLHASGVRAVVVILQLVPVGSFGISDGHPKTISGPPQGLRVPRDENVIHLTKCRVAEGCVAVL